MKRIFYLLAITLALFACKSNEPVLTECQEENVGYFAFENKSSNAYDIFINGSLYKQQPGNSISSSWIKYPAGKAYTIKVQQVAGYILYPTVKTYNITLNQCDKRTVTFP